MTLRVSASTAPRVSIPDFPKSPKKGAERRPPAVNERIGFSGFKYSADKREIQLWVMWGKGQSRN